MAYEAQIRQIARQLISKHGDLSEVRCVSGHNPCRIELVFADGERINVGEHSGRVDISIMKAGYHGTGSRCFHAFLEEAGFDVTFEQVVGMKKDTVLRRSHDPSAGEGMELSEFGVKPVREHRPQSREGSQHWEAQMMDFIRAGRKIDAIKLYRKATGSGLKDAKEYIDSMMTGAESQQEFDRLTAELIEIYKADGFLADSPGDKFNKDLRNISAIEIGEHLNEMGGKKMMQHAHSEVKGALGGVPARELEWIWDGVGEWLG